MFVHSLAIYALQFARMKRRNRSHRHLSSTNRQPRKHKEGNTKRMVLVVGIAMDIRARHEGEGAWDWLVQHSAI